MNKLCCLIIMFITCRICEGQNLVPNGSFEQYSSCPTGYGQLDSALLWHNPTFTSPDYFNQCAGNGFAGVPENNFGYQPAHTGVAYAGIVGWDALNSDWREYIEIPLSSPLTAFQFYHFEMHVCLAENSDNAIDALQVYFSTIFVSVPTFLQLPFPFQISNMTGFITDTLNWTLISGDYFAGGGENHLIIGNFKNDANTIVQPTGFGFIQEAYYYIDDVSLVPITTGADELNQNTSLNIFPNPFSGKIDIISDKIEISEIILYDISSRKLLQQQFINSVSLSTTELEKGIYLYEVRNKNGVIKKGKIVKD